MRRFRFLFPKIDDFIIIVRDCEMLKKEGKAPGTFHMKDQRGEPDYSKGISLNVEVHIKEGKPFLHLFGEGDSVSDYAIMHKLLVEQRKLKKNPDPKYRNWFFLPLLEIDD